MHVVVDREGSSGLCRTRRREQGDQGETSSACEGIAKRFGKQVAKVAVGLMILALCYYAAGGIWPARGRHRSGQRYDPRACARLGC